MVTKRGRGGAMTEGLSLLRKWRACVIVLFAWLSKQLVLNWCILSRLAFHSTVHARGMLHRNAVGIPLLRYL